MGDPTEPGEDQETTIVIEGPPAGADDATVAAFNADFEKFKEDMGKVLKSHKKMLNCRLRKIVYMKKGTTR